LARAIRLGEVVAGAEAERFDCGLERALSSDDDRFYVEALIADRAQGLGSGKVVGHRQVEQDHGEITVAEELASFPAARRRDHVVVGLEDDLQRLAWAGLVVDYQYVGFGIHRGRLLPAPLVPPAAARARRLNALKLR